MHSRSLVPTAVLALIALACMRDPEAATAPGPAGEPAIVFVCQNGVAMSVWSALTFDRLAAERGLPLRAGSRAATFTDVPFRMKLALALDGMRLGDYRPQVISAADLVHAQHVILIDDAELPVSLSDTSAAIERWSGFPPMREQYFASRAALQTRVEELVVRLQSPRSP